MVWMLYVEALVLARRLIVRQEGGNFGEAEAEALLAACCLLLAGRLLGSYWGWAGVFVGFAGVPALLVTR